MKNIMMKMMYPCEKIREFVYDYADGKLDGLVAMRFKMHISKCKDCNEFVRIYQIAADIRKFQKIGDPPQALVDKTMEFLEKEGIADFSSDNEDGIKPGK